MSQIALHLGHMGELAGHEHWVAGGVIAVTGAVGLWAWLTRGKDKPSDEAANDELAAEAEDTPDAPEGEQPA